MKSLKIKIPQDGNAIRVVNREIVIPDDPIIPYIEGDGIGKDISNAMRRIVDAAVTKVSKGQRKIAWMEIFAGEKAYDLCGSYLPD